MFFFFTPVKDLFAYHDTTSIENIKTRENSFYNNSIGKSIKTKTAEHFVTITNRYYSPINIY